MISLVCIWSLVFVYGVLCESPTHPPYDNEPDSPTFSAQFDYRKFASSLFDTSASSEEWRKLYEPYIYPLYKMAIQTLASSDQGAFILWKLLGRPIQPQSFCEQICGGFNPKVDGTTEEDETTMYNLDFTEPEASEFVSDVHSREERVADTNEDDSFYHTSDSNDRDVVDVYYTTENPEAEVVVLDDSYYSSSIAPEQRSSTDMDMGDLYQDPSAEAEVTRESGSNVAISENEVGVLRRSGVLVEKRPSAETDGSGLRVGSIRGIPGKDFPCYDEIPITSFTCADKRIPGIYADLETGCQVFHVCWSNRRESFLCPIGTTFNQPITSCDYWYSSNCSLSSLYFESTTESQTKVTRPGCKKTTCNPQTTESSSTERHTTEKPILEEDWFRNFKFEPVKTKVTVYFKPKDHSKHHSSKKTISKADKPTHDIMPLVEEFIELTKIVAQDVIKLVPKVVKPEIKKSKFVKPAAKLEPCLEIDDHHKPTPSVVQEPKPLPTLNPRFIVKPVDVKEPLVKVHYEKKTKLASPKVKHPSVQTTKVVHLGKDHAAEIVLKALEMAGDVFQRDILALTRQAMAQDHKPKH